MKAAFIYNFALFTEWPGKVLAEADSVTVCFSAASDMQVELNGLNGKSVRNRVLKTRPLASLETGLNECHVLFVEARDRPHWLAIRKKLASTAILTVTDDGEIGRDGAMIVLSLNGSKMAFDIDQSAARQSGLMLSSKLLRLARRVR